MRLAILLALAAACSKADDAASKPLLEQVRRYCAIDDLPLEEAKVAMDRWMKDHASNRELLTLMRAATSGDEKARATLRAAIDAAVAGRCPPLQRMMEILPAKVKP